MISLNEAAEIVRNCSRPIISGHVSPDGDSLGSVLALGLGLQSLGKDVTMVSSDPVPDLYSFLPGVEKIIIEKVPDRNYDLFIALDCSVLERLGSPVVALLDGGNLATLVIDHHVNARPFGQYNFVAPTFAATGEIIMDILSLLKVELDQDIAINLYTAIVTDTGSFRYENTTPQCHLRAAKLIELGVPVARMSNMIFGEQPIESVRLLEAALRTLRISDCGQIAWLSISKELVQSVGANDQHIDGLINYPRKIKGVELAIVFREVNDGVIKVSLRSKYNVDVNMLVSKFGGGGHVRASGCTIHGGLPEAVQMVLEEAQKVIRGC